MAIVLPGIRGGRYCLSVGFDTGYTAWDWQDSMRGSGVIYSLWQGDELKCG